MRCTRIPRRGSLRSEPLGRHTRCLATRYSGSACAAACPTAAATSAPVPSVRTRFRAICGCTGLSLNETCHCPTCSVKIQEVIGEAFQLTGGVSLFFSFTEFIGVWLTVRYRNQKDPSGGNPSAFL
ncbi:Tetraspanin-13 [Orchesella cincta]|uniref:Tetraspanin-13 n=1 Tax=Orchesella cincta TaxID=48709 RepID=A0A1D2MG29_ORCCI|nr:Tetraspanin-13 [Orchesella cincta]